MSKPLVFALLLGLAIIASGVFGALHNQLSYSVGASYFHDLKFGEFGISQDLRNRLGASIVGWQASWWMGLVAGIPAFALGLILIRTPKRYMAAGLSAIGAVIFVTLLFTMGGLVLGMVAPSIASELPIPEGVRDIDSFLRAAMMHGASYIGGLVGILAGLHSVWLVARDERRLGMHAT